MKTMILDQTQLQEILAGLLPGEKVTIVSEGVPVAVVKKADNGPWPSQAGCHKVPGFWMADDFNAPLDEFKEYME